MILLYHTLSKRASQVVCHCNRPGHDKQQYSHIASNMSIDINMCIANYNVVVHYGTVLRFVARHRRRPHDEHCNHHHNDDPGHVHDDDQMTVTMAMIIIMNMTMTIRMVIESISW